ncbi:MAG: HTH-type transcriptional regulator/antitoxin HigA [Psychroserpens sp.]|jgi:HTH-type transcriptional regulator/antitoxin HigA
MKITIIKTEQQYVQYLDECERLLNKQSETKLEDNERLELLSVLIEKYEETNYPLEAIDPIDAIKFRMKQKGLKQVDLAPYFGTKSRVSEVLNKKRPLTVQMIRALSTGLGLSVDTLVGTGFEQVSTNSESNDIDWNKFPLKEMEKMGWINSIKNASKSLIEEQLKFFVGAFSDDIESPTAAFKKTLKGDAYSPTSHYKLIAWLSKVILDAEKETLENKFDKEALSKTFLKELASLSWFDDGPKLAVEYLNKYGIKVIIVPALKGMALDGAALLDRTETPVIALTLKENRLDNFWFTLLHETVHVWKHICKGSAFVDDLERSTEDKVEAEANRIARDTFIPRTTWKRSEAYLKPSVGNIESLAKDLRIHPSIIAGRVRRETGNYKMFSEFVGFGEVQKHFPQFNKKV